MQNNIGTKMSSTGERRNDDLQDDIKPRDVNLTYDSEKSACTPEENTEQLDEVILEDGNGQMPQQQQEIQPHEMHKEEQNPGIQQRQMQTEEQEPEVMEGTNRQLYPSQPISNVLKKSEQIRFKLPLHEKLGKKLGKVGVPRKSQLSHL